MYAFMLTLGYAPLDGTTNTVHMDEDIAVLSRITDGESIFDEEQGELKLMAEVLGMPDSWE